MHTLEAVGAISKKGNATSLLGLIKSNIPDVVVKDLRTPRDDAKP